MIANIHTPDALLVQDYIAGNEESLSVLIKDMNQIYGFIYSKIADRDTSNDIFRILLLK
jgi:RNA polymerase sigma-70 factor (ECF subfamily)